MRERIVVVTGTARSGTSAMMQMLRAGGMELHVDEGNLIACESEDALKLPGETEWLEACRGKVVKVLEPLKFRLPERYEYDFILMRRDPMDCGLSHAKMLRAVCGIGVGESDALRFGASIARDATPINNLLASYVSRVLPVRFDAMISDPAHTARRLRRHFQHSHDLDEERMAAVIVPRTTGVYRGLLEVELLAAHEKLAERAAQANGQIALGL